MTEKNGEILRSISMQKETGFPHKLKGLPPNKGNQLR